MSNRVCQNQCCGNGSTDNKPNTAHTNAFVNLNGIPYLLAEYVDREGFQQIDRSVINSNVVIDTTEAMRAIIDISIDDIGKKSSGGLNVIGNNTKQKDLLVAIKNNALQLSHKLPVLKSGIVIRVHYCLENNRTGQILRSMVEDLRIKDRSYFIDINSKDINDNAIITNFSASMVSTINNFTYGTDPMIIRITSIQLGYEYVKNNPLMPKVVQSSMCVNPMVYNQFEQPDPSTYNPYLCTAAGMYNYHQQMQSVHMMTPGYHTECMVPESWSMFSRFYHFDERGTDIILHQQEIDDQNNKTVFMACGSIQINRAFLINPGHRLIFKFSIWKNDVTLVNDTSAIAGALQAYVGGFGPCVDHTHDHQPEHDCDCHEPPHHSHHSSSVIDYQQNMAINQIMKSIAELNAKIKEMNGEEPDPNPELPSLPEGPNCNCKPNSEQLATIVKEVSVLQEQILDLAQRQEADEAKAEVLPMSDDDIAEAIGKAAEETDEHADCNH